ncbi:hypothetical protein IJG71_01245 [Candidatus Saccharibacteria bacterium]|nr:hypothetical protein [Candidatus Saccharibacteria bacterium]
MGNSLKKRGRKFIRRFSSASKKAQREGKEHIKENLFERLSHIRHIRLLIFEWGLLVFALIMLAVAQAFWFGDSYAENTFTSGGTYTEATLGDVNSMNPLFATTSSEKVLSRLMFATISAPDFSGHPKAQLAKSITATEGGKKWVVRLRDNLKWSDGEPITVDDVVFTTNLIKNPAVNTVYSSNLARVKVSVDEENNIVFELPTAYADFISALNIPIVPKHILGENDPKTIMENNFSNSPVTSGPFSFNAVQSNSNEGEKVFYLSNNENYYLGNALLNSFAVHTYSSKDAVINAINSGSVTATAELSGLETKGVMTGQFFERNSSLNSGAFIFFNLSRKSVSDQELRNAIRQGIDLEKIRASAPDTLPLDYPILSSQIGISEYPELPSRDYETAKATIQELAGEEKIHLDVATVNSGYLSSITDTLVGELESLGIEVNVSVYEENQEFITNVISRRGYDILVYEVEFGADPDLLPYYHSSQASTTGLNLSNYKNALVDDLLLGARDTTDESLRIKKYETFLEYWVNDVPAIALYRPNLTYFYNKNVRTFNNDIRLVTALDRFTDVTDWAVNRITKNKTP